MLQFCCNLLLGAAILLQNARFVQFAKDHIHLPQPYSLRQFAANRNNEPKKKFPDGVTNTAYRLRYTSTLSTY